MNRASHLLAATVVGAIAVGSLSLGAQAPANPPPKAPEMKSVLQGKKFTPPIRGEATVDIIKSPTRREGTTLVIKQGPAYEVVARNTLDDGFDASPALVDRDLYLRGYKYLYCLTAASGR